MFRFTLWQILCISVIYLWQTQVSGNHTFTQMTKSVSNCVLMLVADVGLNWSESGSYTLYPPISNKRKTRSHFVGRYPFYVKQLTALSQIKFEAKNPGLLKYLWLQLHGRLHWAACTTLELPRTQSDMDPHWYLSQFLVRVLHLCNFKT